MELEAVTAENKCLFGSEILNARIAARKSAASLSLYKLLCKPTQLIALCNRRKLS